MLTTRVSKSEFKARALELCRQVETSGQSLIITHRGEPTVEVRPYRNKTRAALDVLRNSVIHYKDPTEPIGLADWEAARGLISMHASRNPA